MIKQKTFESRYEGIVEHEAIAWLLNLSNCFKIRSAKFRSYIHKTNWDKVYRCQVEVSYE
jgi:hypothetical protein